MKGSLVLKRGCAMYNAAALLAQLIQGSAQAVRRFCLGVPSAARCWRTSC